MQSLKQPPIVNSAARYLKLPHNVIEKNKTVLVNIRSI